MFFSKPCKHNNHGHCLWCEVEKENQEEYKRLALGLCEHGKKGKCVMCESERLMKEIDEALKDVREFVKKTDREILDDTYKGYQKEKMKDEYGVKNRLGKWL